MARTPMLGASGCKLCVGAFAASSPRSQLYVTSLKALDLLHLGVSECLGDPRGLRTAVLVSVDLSV